MRTRPPDAARGNGRREAECATPVAQLVKDWRHRRTGHELQEGSAYLDYGPMQAGSGIGAGDGEEKENKGGTCWRARCISNVFSVSSSSISVIMARRACRSFASSTVHSTCTAASTHVCHECVCESRYVAGGGRARVEGRNGKERGRGYRAGERKKKST